MSEIDIHQGGGEIAAQIVQPGMLRVADELQAHVQALRSADVLAGMIHQTVQAYDGGVDHKGKQRAGRKEAAIAIYHGQQLGLNPLASLQNIFIVHGQPSMFARTMKALVVQAGHEVQTVESGPTSVTVRGRRAGSEHWEECTWTIERARKAKYTSNSKYDTEPENMLYAKATAELCRRIAPDVLLGMAYSAEELEEQHAVQATAEIVKPAANATTAGKVRGAITARRKSKPEPAPAADPAPEQLAAAADDQYAAARKFAEQQSGKPYQQGEPTPEPEPTSDEVAKVDTEPAPAAEERPELQLIGDKDIRALHVLMAAEGVEPGSPAANEWLAAQVHREIAGTADLTAAEGAELIAAMQAWQAKDREKGN